MERWRFTVTQGWPMMAATNGNLVVAVVMNNAWMWRSMSSMGWFPFGAAAQGGTQNATLVGLNLATGQQQWSATLPGAMASYPQFSSDGSRIYVSVTDFGQASMMGSGPMRQGDTGGWATQMTNKVVALDRNGNVLWTTDLSQSGGMMMP
jgi:outer membrane protein assembly factor BamB